MVSIPQSGFWWVEHESIVSIPGHCASVSIPQSGFWWVELEAAEEPRAARDVSIPQSGFWWVEQVSARRLQALQRRFNPPVGILVG